MGQTRPLFVYFHSFHMTKYSTNTINEKSVNGVLGTRTQGGKMVGADESTELWRHPNNKLIHLIKFKIALRNKKAKRSGLAR